MRGECTTMPSYDYRCEKCRRRFAVVQRISEHTGRSPACPKCKSRRTLRVLAPFFAKTGRKS
ncbi:MAG: zinc ribbon domain-containing protein [Gemmatimonadota bacterium]